MVLRGTPWYEQVHHGLKRYTMVLRGTPWYEQVHHGLKRYTMVLRGTCHVSSDVPKAIVTKAFLPFFLL